MWLFSTLGQILTLNGYYKPWLYNGIDKGWFHEATNHDDARQQPNKLDRRDRFNWSADQCCPVFPLNCGHCWFSGHPIEPFYSILQRQFFLGRRPNFSYLVTPRYGPFRGVVYHYGSATSAQWLLNRFLRETLNCHGIALNISKKENIIRLNGSLNEIAKPIRIKSKPNLWGQLTVQL